jgi:hypothetical protein
MDDVPVPNRGPRDGWCTATELTTQYAFPTAPRRRSPRIQSPGGFFLMEGHTVKAQSLAAADRGLRRRLVALSLDVAPGDLQQVTGAHPVKISGVLKGSRRLHSTEAATVGKLIGRRAARLFTD